MAVTIHDPAPASIAPEPFVCDQVYGPGGQKDVPGILGNPYPYGECTWLCWQYFHVVQGIDLPPALGNANQWIVSAQRHGWIVDQDAVVGKIACWTSSYPPFGHLAIVSEVRGPADYTVKEMNFTYLSAANAGRVDCRIVGAPWPDGFITPSGATTGGPGSPGSPPSTGNSILDALSAPFSGIAASIEKAALYAQAEVMTAEEKLLALSMMGLGGVMMGGGGVLAALTMAGGGSPGRGYARVRSRLPSGPSEPQRPSQRAQELSRMTASERAWARRLERAGSDRGAALAAEELADRARTRRVARRAQREGRV